MATFGHTDTSGLSAANSSQISACKFSVAEAGTISAVKAYVRSTSGSVDFSVAVYSDNSGLPNAKLAQVASPVAVSSATENWYTFSMSSAFEAGTYWLCVWSSGSTGQMFYVAGASAQYKEQAGTFSTWPDPFGTPNWSGSWELAIYAEYDTGATSILPHAQHYYQQQ